MKPDVTITEQILNTVPQRPDCTMEESVAELPETAWSQVFLEVDRLRRLGLIARGVGSDAIRLRAPRPCQVRSFSAYAGLHPAIDRRFSYECFKRQDDLSGVHRQVGR